MCLDHAWSIDGRIRYNDFTQMSKGEQVQTINMIHEFLTEFEFQYRYKQLQKKKSAKYEAYLKILSSIISSAHAEELYNNLNAKNKCYYAGWISFTIKTSRGPVCVHPKNIKNKSNLNALARAYGFNNSDSAEFKNSNAFKYYTKEIADKYNQLASGKSLTANLKKDNSLQISSSKNSCKTSSAILCQPDIYGQAGDNSICVVDQGPYGANASFLCHQATQKIKEDMPEAYNQMMDGIIKNGLQNPSGSLINTMEVMYDSCLCGGDAGVKNSSFQDSISPEYVKKIFGSRTCAGILAHTKTIATKAIAACKEAPDSFKESKARELLDFMANAEKVMKDNTKSLKNKMLQFQLTQGSNYNEKKAKELFNSDYDIFKDAAQKIFNEAVSQGLCKEDTEKPKLMAKYLNEKIEVIIAMTDDKAFIAQEKMDIEVSAEEGQKSAEVKKNPPSSGKDKQSSSAVVTFSVIPAVNDSQAKAFAEVDGAIIYSNSVVIPGNQKIPELILSFNSGKLIAEAVNIPDSKKTEFEISDPTILSPETKAQINKTSDLNQKLKKEYTVELLEKSFDVEFTLTGPDNFSDKKTIKIPGKSDGLKIELGNFLLSGEKLLTKIPMTLQLAGREPVSGTNIDQDKLSQKEEEVFPLIKIAEEPEYFVNTPVEEKDLKLVYSDNGVNITSNQIKVKPINPVCELIKEDDGIHLNIVIDEEITGAKDLITYIREPIIDGYQLKKDSRNVFITTNTPSIALAEKETEESKPEKEQDTPQLPRGRVKFVLGGFSKDLECLPKEEKEIVASECNLDVKVETNKDGLTQIQGILSIEGKSEEELTALNDEISLYYYDQSQEIKEKDESDEERNEEEIGSDQAIAGANEERPQNTPASGKRKKLDEKFKLLVKQRPSQKGIKIKQKEVDRKITIVAQGAGCDVTKDYVLNAPSFNMGNSDPVRIQNQQRKRVRAKGTIQGMR